MRIALQSAARRERDRARDVRVRQFRPRRLREVERRDARQRFTPALRSLLAQLAGDLVLGDPFELAVVIEQTHVQMASRRVAVSARLARNAGVAAARARRGRVAHTPLSPEENVWPGPWIRTNQIMKAPAQTAAVTANTR